jgi:hypothetical protein
MVKIIIMIHHFVIVKSGILEIRCASPKASEKRYKLRWKSPPPKHPSVHPVFSHPTRNVPLCRHSVLRKSKATYLLVDYNVTASSYKLSNALCCVTYVCRCGSNCCEIFDFIYEMYTLLYYDEPNMHRLALICVCLLQLRLFLRLLSVR